MLAMLAATLLMHALVRRVSPLDTVGALGRLLVAIAVGTAVSATVGALSLVLGDVVAGDEVPTVWRTWWLGDFAGALVVVPLAIAWARPPARGWWRERSIEGVAVLVAVAVVSQFALSRDRPLSYLVFPALIWAALRFGQRGATLAVAIVVGFTAWNTAHYTGPFAYQSITHSVLITQLFIAVAALATLCLAAVVSERQRFAEGLSASRTRLVEAADTERRRLEHNLHDGAQQRLTALALRLRQGVEDAKEAPDRAAAVMDAAEAEVSLAIDELRDLAQGIHPGVLTDRGPAHAIESIAAGSTPTIELRELPSTRFDETAEATAYYVVAEALTNALRYASTSLIWVDVAVAHGSVHVEVGDDGVGGAAERSGSGLQGLRDRVEAAGGTFDVVSAAGSGTRAGAEIPLRLPA
jgi:signal transduction histidine kinase